MDEVIYPDGVMERPLDKLPTFYQVVFHVAYGQWAMLFEVAFEVCLGTEG